MSDAEAQEEEREALLSIYDGDLAFKQLNATTYQYKFGEDNDNQSFLLEISWDSNYPTKKPIINMNTFYNKHIIQEVKDKIVSHIEVEADQWLGSAMTYTLFQSVQENLPELLIDQPTAVTHIEPSTSNLKEPVIIKEEVEKKPKQQLTKSQKKKLWNRTDGKNENPRGWNWVDVVKHLSQIGFKEKEES